MKKRILIIDDDPDMLVFFKRMISPKNYEIITCQSGHEGISKIQDKEHLDLIICDQFLGDVSAIDILTCTQNNLPQTPFIIITGYGSIPKAVESMKKGAFEYIAKPIEKHKILAVIERAIAENKVHIDSTPPPTKHQILYASTRMEELLDIISQIAKTDTTVLIQGESGTGKELVAREIHRQSLRSDAPFVPINCGILSDSLLENELFGHVRGAFTGATYQKDGLLKEAHTGTVFLDEVGDLPLTVQTKLLRVLQEREFKPLGSNENMKVDLRFIAATNVELDKAVRDKKFREDLYYRLAVIPILMPPLRDRLEDIPILAMYFARKYGKKNAKKIRMIDENAIARLKRHNWPGNVRELENTIERAVALTASDIISEDLLWRSSKVIGKDNLHPASPDISQEEGYLKEIIHRDTKQAIIKALEVTKGNRSKAARILGISRASLYQKLKQYQLYQS